MLFVLLGLAKNLCWHQSYDYTTNSVICVTWIGQNQCWCKSYDHTNSAIICVLLGLGKNLCWCKSYNLPNESFQLPFLTWNDMCIGQKPTVTNDHFNHLSSMAFCLGKLGNKIYIAKCLASFFLMCLEKKMCTLRGVKCDQ